MDIIIICDSNTTSIALSLKSILDGLGHESKIENKLTIEDKIKDNLYIIIHDNDDYQILPKKYIHYQIEQIHSPIFTSNYIKSMKNSQQIWEFSISNIKKYGNFVNLSTIYYMPIPYYQSDTFESKSVLYDLLFYGTYTERIDMIVERLKKKYNINILYNSDGKEVENAIKQSKIILNFNYYDDAVLETARINEAIRYHKLVISEKSISSDNYNMDLYNDIVVFFDILNNNLSNINQLYETIDYWLDGIVYDEKIKCMQKKCREMQKKSIFHIHKCIASMGMQNNQMIFDLSSEDINCIHLIETPYRIDAFKNQTYVPDYKIYPAVKHSQEWIGCAQSYQNIIWNAQRCNLETVTVCEDDCAFKADFELKYKTIRSFLKQYTSGWDIFVGCVMGLPIDTIFKNIVKYEGLTFIEVDQMHSTGFNIYNKSCFGTIIEWDQANTNGDTNTIDQYINMKRLKIILLYPFEFECLNVGSTLWQNENIYARQLIERKQNEIAKNKLLLGGAKSVIKILNLILYSPGPSYDRMKDIISKYMKSTGIPYYFYYFDDSIDGEFIVEGDLLKIKGTENFNPGITLKTIEALKFSLRYDYDYIVRSNISTIINMPKLTHYLANNPIEYGGGAILNLRWLDPPSGITDMKYWNTLFAQGTAIIMSRKSVVLFIDNLASVDATIMDDVCIGVFFKQFNIPVSKIGTDHTFAINVPTASDNIIFYRNRRGTRSIDIHFMQQIINMMNRPIIPINHHLKNRAYYGAGNVWMDVSHIFFSRFVKNSYLSIPHNISFNDVFGDPVYGVLKRLIYRSDTHNIIIGENRKYDVNQLL